LSNSELKRKNIRKVAILNGEMNMKNKLKKNKELSLTLDLLCSCKLHIPIDHSAAVSR